MGILNVAVNASTDIASAASLFGLNQWQLNNAQYNGVSFTIFDSALNKFNPLAALTGQSVNKFMSTSNAVEGAPTGVVDPNSSLSYNTKLAIAQVNDSLTSKLSIYRPPGYNGYVVQDQGMDGSQHMAMGLFVGDDYMEAFQNFLFACVNPNIDPKVKNKLVHPMYPNVIDNCYIKSINVTYASKRWKALAFEFHFIAAQGLSDQKVIDKKSLLSKVGDIIDDILQTINAISTLLFDVQVIMGLVSNVTNLGQSAYDGNVLNTSPVAIPQPTFGTNSTALSSGGGAVIPTVNTNSGGVVKQPVRGIPYTSKLAIMTQLNNVYSALSNSVIILYQKVNTTGYVNYQIANVKIDYTQVPSIFKYATIITKNEIGQLIQNYVDQITNLIMLYTANSMDTIFSDHIVLLQTSVTQLNSLCKTLINQQDGSYTTYTTPYAMSIRKVCYENGLDFNNQDQVQAILTANQAILNDPNYISKSVKLILPKVGT